MQHYASVVLAEGLCLSVCLSITNRYCIKMADWIQGSYLIQKLPSTYPWL